MERIKENEKVESCRTRLIESGNGVRDRLVRLK